MICVLIVTLVCLPGKYGTFLCGVCATARNSVDDRTRLNYISLFMPIDSYNVQAACLTILLPLYILKSRTRTNKLNRKV